MLCDVEQIDVDRLRLYVTCYSWCWMSWILLKWRVSTAELACKCCFNALKTSSNVRCFCRSLNIFNPMVPDGYHMYNVGRSIEERMVSFFVYMWFDLIYPLSYVQVVKILIGLSKWEPGFNWNDQQFRWSMDVPYVPGWELTQLWTTGECPEVSILFIVS